MPNPDIRWKQRFGNFKKALLHLHDADELHRRYLALFSALPAVLETHLADE